MWYEDMRCFPQLVCCAERIGYYKMPIYYYRQHEAAITHNGDDIRNLDVIKAWENSLYMEALSKEEKTVDVISIDGGIYWRSLKQYVDIDSITDGLIKSEIFALTIILMSCSIGMRTQGGPREIGASVTSTLVQTMVAILTLDYFVTKLLL